MPFHNTVEISANNSYADVYQHVSKFLDEHFDRLPPARIFFDVSGHIKTEKRGYRQIILDLVNGDAVGLLYKEEAAVGQYKDETVELDSLSASLASEFTMLYGYHESAH